MFKTIQEIKDAVCAGKNVYWQHTGYKVVNNDGRFIIHCLGNDNCVGLCWQDGETSDYNPEDFFME